MMPSSAGLGLADVVQVAGERFANFADGLADDGPDGVVRVLRLERQVEADELVVLLDELERLLARADLLGDAIELVVEHVTQPFREDQRQDEVLELRRLLRPANTAGGVPNPRFERLVLWPPSRTGAVCAGISPTEKARLAAVFSRFQ